MKKHKTLLEKKFITGKNLNFHYNFPLNKKKNNKRQAKYSQSKSFQGLQNRQMLHIRSIALRSRFKFQTPQFNRNQRESARRNRSKPR